MTDTSDMDMSSDVENIHPIAPLDTETINSKDEIQNGLDFIRFESDSEKEAEKATNHTSNSSAGAVQAQKRLAPASLPGQEPQSHKRKRSQDDDEDISSITAGPTGPPPGCPWMGRRNYWALPTAQQMLTQEFKDFVTFISPTREEHQVRKYIFRVIKVSVQRIWPGAQVRIFGSFDTQLYLPTSDLDVVVLLDMPYKHNCLYKLATYLRDNNLATDVTVIKTAKVPLVKFKEIETNIACDVSFNITSGLSSSAVVKRSMEEWPVLRPMVLILKYFLMIKGYNEVFNGGLGSYTTMLMILSFLQMHPQLQSKRIDAGDNLGLLLIEFFELYGVCYNYQHVGFSVKDGGSYFKRTTIGGMHALTSVDPNDDTNNTAKGSFKMQDVRKQFVQAYIALTSNLKQRVRETKQASSASWARHQRSEGRRPELDDQNRVPANSAEKSSGLHRQRQQVSLIDDVFKVPDSILKHRALVQSVFYENTFQDMFGDPEGITGLDEIERREEEGADSEMGQWTDPQPESSKKPPKRPRLPLQQQSALLPTLPDIEFEEHWVPQPEDELLEQDRDAKTPTPVLSRKLAEICYPEVLKDPKRLDMLWEARRKVIRLVTRRRIVERQQREGETQLQQEECDAFFNRSRLDVDSYLGPLLKAKSKLMNAQATEARAKAAAEEALHASTGWNKAAGPISFKGAASAASASTSTASGTLVNSADTTVPATAATTASSTAGETGTSTAQGVTGSMSSHNTVSPISHQASNAPKAASSKPDVVYIDLDTDDDEEKTQEDKYFDDLMKQGAEEYEVIDSDDDNVDSNTNTKSQHNDPTNINTSGDSIHLPQLFSA
ncbi:hypothetical protein BGZ94_009746 [Podila epigama]|nr:hypothetical protein BGZ94_009746 [Podila epigama]